MTILRVNMTNLTIAKDPVSEDLLITGGRYVTSKITLQEVPPTCHPLGPSNKLIFAPGLLAGTAAPSSGRVSVGGKSPLTGTIKESNAGTPVAQALGRLGIKAIVLEGLPEDKEHRWVLYIDKNEVKLIEATELKMKYMSDTVNALRATYGDKAKFIGIGPAGEMKLAGAGVGFIDTEGRPVRYAGRGGLGAVMGAKCVKAIVVNDEGTTVVQPKDKELFREGVRQFTEALGKHPVTMKGGALNANGTPGVVPVMSNDFYGFPTRNFSLGKWRATDVTSGQYMAEKLLKDRPWGKMGHGCNPGCVIRCSNVYPYPDGTGIASVEYESICLLGSNCDIDNFDDIAELIRLCNEIGLDTIETGAAIGVAMEGGLLEFGDAKKATELLHEVGKGSVVGRMIGNGAETTGKVLGVYRVPVVKGQALPAYDPRAVKGTGVTFATSPMGADHTAGYCINGEVFGVGCKMDPLGTDGKADYSRALQIETAFVDSTGYCLFTTFASTDDPYGMDGMLKTLTAFTGKEFTTESPKEIGTEIIKMELDFNRKAGFTKANDRLPEFFYKEKLPIVEQIYDVTDEDMDSVWENF